VFTIKTEPFGKIHQVKLVNIHTGEYVGILSDCGCALNSLVLKKSDKLFDLIDGSETYEQLLLEGLSAYKGSFLFPFPNRLKNGKYTFEDKVYEFEQNDSENRPNALHGSYHDQKFNLSRFQTFDDKAEIDFSYQAGGNDSSYPFAFKLCITYTLHYSEGLTINTKVTNVGNGNMPVGFGWHPYFKSVDKIDQMLLHFPDSESIEFDSNMIPTGKLIPNTLFKTNDSVGSTQLDNSFRLINPDKKTAVSLIDPEHNVRINVWQETGEDKFDFFQTYIPPHRKTIAIEPMTCAPDAFNNKMGLNILKPQQILEAKWGISLV
jgi:aldose 1-epimerase